MFRVSTVASNPTAFQVPLIGQPAANSLWLDFVGLQVRPRDYDSYFGFRVLGFRGLGFRGLGFRGLGFRGLGFRI